VAKFEFGYDGQGRGIWKKSYSPDGAGWSLSETRNFAYDGDNLFAEFVLQGDGSQKPDRSHTWGADLGGGIGGLLSVTYHGAASPVTYYPFYGPDTG
jgi:hypothetical protein